VIRDFANNQPMDNVNIRNIHTSLGMTTAADGQFSIWVKKGELLEFSKIGYQTLRIRIHNEKEPSYYALVMEKVPIQLKEVDIKGKPLDFVSDSIRYRQAYNIVMSKPKKEELDLRNMPLAMLSRKNRQEWAFQKMYAEWEQEKFIDFTFNERLVQKITYLQGDTLQLFMKRYRPTYEFLRTVGDYEYLDYIKRCYYRFEKELKLPVLSSPTRNIPAPVE
jgi:hypothetical protein